MPFFRAVKKGLTTRPKKTGLRFLIYSKKKNFRKKNFQKSITEMF